MNVMILTFISFSLIILINTKLIAEKVVIAINCGGEEFVDSDGVKYLKDHYYDGGVSSDHGLNYDIAGTKDMELYQTERWHSDTLTYSIPLKESGKYVLILKFSEVYFNMPEEKVFDVAIGKKIIIKDLDIFAKAGKATAHDEYIEFELKDDRVFINKVEAPGAYDAKNKNIRVKFVKGSKDNPKINAIALLKGTIYDTDFADKKKVQDDSNKKKLQDAKKKILIEIRHHPDEIFDEDAVLSDESDTLLLKEDPSIISIFFTRQGVYIIMSLAVFFGLNYLIDISEGFKKK